MSRKARTSRGILGVPKRAGRQVFVFGRYAEELPSDESDDPDFTPSAEEALLNTANNSRGNKKSKKKEGGAKKQKLGKKENTKTRAKDIDIQNREDGSCDVSRGWTELIPTEILLAIFQHAIKQIRGSSIPFLCRMSRVCRRWRDVASEPRLWREVNLSTFGLNITTSATILQKLAPVRLKHTKHLTLDGWSKLTDKGIQAVGKYCHELEFIRLSQCESLTSQSIASLPDKCHNLTGIDVDSTKIEITGLQRIVTSLGGQLKNLCIQNCTRLTGGRILPLIQGNCPNLEFLNVSGTEIRTIRIEKLQAGCPKLRGLFLANLSLNSTPKTNEKKANGFPDLTSLDLSCGGYFGMDQRNNQLLYRILWSSHNLEYLIIRGPNMVTAEGFKSLPDSPLKHLTYNNASFPKVAAIVEKWHRTLEHLDISSNRGVDDECMELLSNFGMPSLTILNLSDTNITSDGVRSALIGCPNLELLNLCACRGLPRGVKCYHGKLGIENLPWKLTEAENSD